MCAVWCLSCGILFEELQIVRQNRYKQTTSSHIGDSLLLFTIVITLSTSRGRAGMGREQPRAARLDWIGFMTWKPPLNVSIDTKPNLSGDTKVGPSGESRIFDTTGPILHLKEFVRPGLHNSPLFIFIHHPSFHRSSTNNLHNKTFKSRAVAVKNQTIQPRYFLSHPANVVGDVGCCSRQCHCSR